MKLLSTINTDNEPGDRKGLYLKDVSICNDILLVHKTIGVFSQLKFYSIHGGLVRVIETSDNIESAFLTVDGFATLHCCGSASNGPKWTFTLWTRQGMRLVSRHVVGWMSIAADGSYSVVEDCKGKSRVKIHDCNGYLIHEHIVPPKCVAIRPIMYDQSTVAVLCDFAEEPPSRNGGGNVIYVIRNGEFAYLVKFSFDWCIYKAYFCGDDGRKLVLNSANNVPDSRWSYLINIGQWPRQEDNKIDQITLIPDSYILCTLGDYIVISPVHQTKKNTNIVRILAADKRFITDLYKLDGAILRSFAFKNRLAIQTSDKKLHVFDTTFDEEAEKLVVTSAMRLHFTES